MDIKSLTLGLDSNTQPWVDETQALPLAMEKHSSFLSTFINYECKKFCNTVTKKEKNIKKYLCQRVD